MEFDPTEHPHVRFNPLTGSWVLASPHRCKRPWAGSTQPEEEPQPPPSPLRPGATRANGQKNPNYTSTYVFPNDFPALLERAPAPSPVEDKLFQVAQARGTCRVMCFHPDSTKTIALMTLEEIHGVVREFVIFEIGHFPNSSYARLVKLHIRHTMYSRAHVRWVNQMTELGRKYTWVQIFENRGSAMGCSDPHPHCQIWASSFLPNEPRVKDRCQKEFYTQGKKAMLVEYLDKELQKKERIVIQNTEWVALVPFWAQWPFETMLLPKNGRPQRLTDLNDAQQMALADIMKGLTTVYDNLFKCSFPYSMGWHGAPTGPGTAAGDSPHWLLHAIYYPPLLRSASVKKFMVGYEMLAQPQRDLTPEQAAGRLRECSRDKHYAQM